MTTLPKSGQVVKVLGVPGVYSLIALIHRGAIPAPAKDGSGSYVWTEQDIARAREALKIDRRKKEFRRVKAAAATSPAA
jgi:hypothetical protein